MSSAKDRKITQRIASVNLAHDFKQYNTSRVTLASQAAGCCGGAEEHCVRYCTMCDVRCRTRVLRAGKVRSPRPLFSTTHISLLRSDHMHASVPVTATARLVISMSVFILFYCMIISLAPSETAGRLYPDWTRESDKAGKVILA